MPRLGRSHCRRPGDGDPRPQKIDRRATTRDKGVASSARHAGLVTRTEREAVTCADVAHANGTLTPALHASNLRQRRCRAEALRYATGGAAPVTPAASASIVP